MKTKRGSTVLVRELDAPPTRAIVKHVHKDGTVTLFTGNRRVGEHELIPDRVRVSVTITWGREWNGSYFEMTHGRGVRYEIIENEPVYRDRGPGFRGCPIGTGTTLDEAIADFVSRARHEWLGVAPLSATMFEVVRTTDTRSK